MDRPLGFLVLSRGAAGLAHLLDKGSWLVALDNVGQDGVRTRLELLFIPTQLVYLVKHGLEVCHFLRLHRLVLPVVFLEHVLVLVPVVRSWRYARVGLGARSARVEVLGLDLVGSFGVAGLAQLLPQQVVHGV